MTIKYEHMITAIEKGWIQTVKETKKKQTRYSAKKYRAGKYNKRKTINE